MHKAQSWNSQGAFMHEPPPMLPGAYNPADLIAYQHYQSQLLQSMSGLPSLSAALQESSPNMQQPANMPVGSSTYSSNASTVPPPPAGNPPLNPDWNTFLPSKALGSAVAICNCGCGLPVAPADSQQALASLYLQQAHSTTNTDYQHLVRHASQHSHHPSQVTFGSIKGSCLKRIRKLSFTFQQFQYAYNVDMSCAYNENSSYGNLPVNYKHIHI